MEVAGAEVEGDIAEGFVGELFEGLGFDEENFFAVEGLGANAVVGNFAPRGLDAFVLVEGAVLVCAHVVSLLSWAGLYQFLSVQNNGIEHMSEAYFLSCGGIGRLILSLSIFNKGVCFEGFIVWFFDGLVGGMCLG